MNEKRLIKYGLWTLPALALSFVGLLPDGENVAAEPLTILGKGLRALSLSGALGNAAAVALYLVVSLLPLLPLLCGALRGKGRREDFLLPVVSASALYSIYYSVNPGLRPEILSGTVGTVALEGATVSVFLAWGVLRFLRRLRERGDAEIFRALRIFLLLFAAFYVLAEFGGGLRELRLSLDALRENNTASWTALLPTRIFLGLRFAAKATECGLTTRALLLGASLVAEIQKSPFGEESGEAAVCTAKWCGRSLTAITLLAAGLNLGQIFLAESLYALSVQLSVPLLSLTVVLAILTVAGLLARGRRLKADVDLFI